MRLTPACCSAGSLAYFSRVELPPKILVQAATVHSGSGDLCRRRARPRVDQPDADDHRQTRCQRSGADRKPTATARAVTGAAAQRDHFRRAGGTGRWPWDPGENATEQIRRRRHAWDTLAQRGKTSLPGLDCRHERCIGPAAGLDVRALSGIQRAQHILGRQSVDVFFLVHRPRQSLSCARLRRSHVFTVATGRSIRLEISSRVIPK